MIQTKRNFVFDFDSTLTSVEALDVLAEITLVNNPAKDQIIDEIIDITNLGIDGKISFTESLERRIKLLNAKKSDLPILINQLRKKVSVSIERNKEFFEKFSDDIYVISCGFKEFIDDIVKDYNIPTERVYANTFEFDKNGVIVGFDANNVLSTHNGKIQCLKDLGLEGEIQVIGDGYSDYVTREAGVADTFFAYTENVSREKTIENADHITPNFDEFLYVNKLPRNISYPKNRIKILLLENVHPDVVELAIGEIIMLMRSVFQRSTELHNGQWNKTAQGSREVRGKKLGIIGYGNIGKQLSVLAEALGMDVYYYDVEDKLALGNATRIQNLEDLLAISDVITLHIDDNAANKDFIGKEELAQMKDGAYLVNLSRGFVVDIKALKDALESGKLAGAAVDVYPEEPRANGSTSIFTHSQKCTRSNGQY